MSDVSRRGFLQLLGAAGGAALLNGVVTRVAFGAGTSDGLLVVVFLRGGLDALNAVVPAFDSNYAKLRPVLGVPAAKVLPLDGSFGLHPSLAALKPHYTAGNLAIVHACGNPDPSRSHFTAQRSMEEAKYQASAANGGWMQRYLSSMPASSRTIFSGVGFSNTMPISLQGTLPSLSMVNLDSFKIYAYPDETARYQAAMWSLYDVAPPPLSTGEMTLGGFGVAAAAAAKPLSSVTYPSSPFGTSLRDVMRLVRGGVGLKAVAVDIHDWDLHADIGSVDSGTLAKKLKDLADTLSAFVTDLGSSFSTTTIAVMSEFGRRASENGSGGTDHGHGGLMFVLGGGITGGRVYGRWPGLGATQLDNGDLAITTDYRDVLSEILVGRLGRSDVSAVFPGYVPTRVGFA